MIDTTLSHSRIIVAGLVVAVVALAAISNQFAPVGTSAGFLVAPAGLLGLVSPVVGYRLYLMIRERVPAGSGTAAGCNAFLRATIAALAVTEGIALFGVVVFMLTSRLPALLGAATHVLLAGAIWPTPERLEAFIRDD